MCARAHARYEWGCVKTTHSHTFFNESKVQAKVNVRNNRNVMHFTLTYTHTHRYTWPGHMDRRGPCVHTIARPSTWAAPCAWKDHVCVRIWWNDYPCPMHFNAIRCRIYISVYIGRAKITGTFVFSGGTVFVRAAVPFIQRTHTARRHHTVWSGGQHTTAAHTNCESRVHTDKKERRCAIDASAFGAKQQIKNEIIAS